MLEAHGYGVIAEAATGVAAVRDAAQLQPDVVLLDIGLPDTSGLDLVAPLRSAAPHTIVVLISTRAATDYGQRLALSSADGFIDKAMLSADALDDVLSRAATP